MIDNTKKNEPKTAQVIDAGLGELNKVRDILFGREMAETDKRFAKLESALDEKLAIMQKSIDESLNGIKARVDEKIHALNVSIDDEAAERLSLIGQVEKNLQTSIKASQEQLTEAINASEDKEQQDLLELRHHFDKQQKLNNQDFVESVDQLREELTVMFRKQADTLQDNKVDRESLALMLDEITVRLRKERK